MSVKFLLIAVDGLGVEALPVLSRLSPALQTVLNQSSIHPLAADGLYSAAAIWSEILTGRRWFENGCPGYSRPSASLSRSEIVSEFNLSFPVNVLPTSNDEQRFPDVAINLPLLAPQTGGRIWLSDGVAGLSHTVWPANLRATEPFSNYRPRPFQSIVEALEDCTGSLQAAAKGEINRLECAVSLCQGKDVNACFLRLNIFDLFAHLMGHDFHLMQRHNNWHIVSEFMKIFDKQLRRLIDCSNQVCLLSAFSHVACTATVNLNILLERAGYAKFLSPAALLAEPDIRLRLQATAALAQQPELASPPMLLRCRPEETLAASPVAGQIFLNRKERYKDGIVERKDSEPLSRRVRQSVEAHLKDLDTTLIVEDLPAAKNSPDFKLFARGIDFSTYGRQTIDRLNKPRSVHSSTGFAIFPSGTTDVQSFAPIDLNSKLMELLR